MKNKRVKCDSGLTGWQGKLQDQYDSFDEFVHWSQTYGLHTRLGYANAEAAWINNPTVQGSTNPSDYRVVKVLYPDIIRIDKVLRYSYNYTTGTQKDAAIKQLLCDLKRLCKLENRKFNSLVREA